MFHDLMAPIVRREPVDLTKEMAKDLRDLGLSVEDILGGGLQEVELTYQGRRFLLRSQLNGEASAALRAAGTAAPPTLREVSASAA